MPIFYPNSLNLAINPLAIADGDMTRCVNVTNDQFFAKKKRPGYATYLGTPDNAEVTSLFNFTLNNGTQFWNYRLSGSVLYYSTQGTGAWTVCGNGTFAGLGTVDNAILNNTLIIGNGVNATRHTTNGTAFTDTTAAPIAGGFADYQNRIYAMGTASDLFYSTTGDATNWNSTGTSDSSSITIPGAGRLNSVMKISNNIVTSKNSGLFHQWNGFELNDLSTKLGPTSASSIGNIEDYRFFGNRLGFFGFGGAKPEIISNPIEKQIYNDAQTGIAGTAFDNMTAGVYKYEYMASVGNTTDDFTNEQVTNAIMVYDFQANTWGNFNFNVRPTSFLTYKDASGVEQFIFGDSTGQCYTYGGTATSDNGSTIASVMEGLLHGGTLRDKKWGYIRLLFNPGAQAQVQIAPTNSFTKQTKNYITLGIGQDGVVEYKFPETTRSKFLFWKITEASRNARFHFYGGEYEFEVIQKA
mgnify:CR=1 FL=1